MSKVRPQSKARPSTPWFEGEEVEAHLDRQRASPEERDFVRTLAADGLARIDLGAAGRALCDGVVADTEAYFQDGKARRVQDAWLRSASVRRLANAPQVRRLLRLAYGREPYPFQTLNFRTGSEQEVHSDAIHFHSQPERFMCGLWVALEDIREESGPLLYHPGSHKLPILTMRGAGVNHERPTYADYGRTYVPALQARLAANTHPVRMALLKKGEAVVWAANLAHGGAPMRDPASTRRSLVVHYYFKGCLPFTPMTSDVEDGRLSVRLPTNLASGLVEWPRRDGALAMPDGRQVKDALSKLLLRRVVVG